MTLPVALDTNLLVRLLTGDEPEQAGHPWISGQRCNPSESEPVPHPGASANPAGTLSFLVRRCPPSRASPTMGRRCHTSGVGLRAD